MKWLKKLVKKIKKSPLPDIFCGVQQVISLVIKISTMRNVLSL